MIVGPKRVKGSSKETLIEAAMTQAAPPPKKEKHRSVRQMMKKVSFVVLQKNTRSLNSSDKIEELIREVQDCRGYALFAFRDVEAKQI